MALFGDSTAKSSDHDVEKVKEQPKFLINYNRDGSGSQKYFFDGETVYYVEVTYFGMIWSFVLWCSQYTGFVERACLTKMEPVEPAVTELRACKGNEYDQTVKLEVQCSFCSKWNVEAEKTEIGLFVVTVECSEGCFHNGTCRATPVGNLALGDPVQFQPCLFYRKCTYNVA